MLGDHSMTQNSKHCLLVVDDEPDLVHSVQDLLRFDYRVLGATRAADGLKIMDKEAGPHRHDRTSACRK